MKTPQINSTVRKKNHQDEHHISPREGLDSDKSSLHPQHPQQQKETTNLRTQRSRERLNIIKNW